MITYSSNELIPSSEFAKKFGSFLSKIKDNNVEKLAILKNNKIEAVMIGKNEYEKLKEAYELIEHIDIAKIVEERKNSKTIDFETLLKEEGISYDEL